MRREREGVRRERRECGGKGREEGKGGVRREREGVRNARRMVWR